MLYQLIALVVRVIICKFFTRRGAVVLPGRNTNSNINGVDVATVIFSEYGDFIHGVIRSKVSDDSQADDLFQDLFLSLVSRSPSGKVQNMKSYLYRIIYNDLIDAMRRVKKYQTHVSRYAEHLTYSTPNGDPQKALIRIEEMKKMLELIEGHLRQSEARAVTLRYRNQHDIGEIAEIMDIDKRSVSRYISVGLKKLRKLFTLKR